MMVEPESQVHLQSYSSLQASLIKAALEPLLDDPPQPVFAMRWDQEQKLWQSQIAYPNELPEEIRQVFEKFGYGCLPVEADIGIVHVCHAADADIESFANKPVSSRWQLIKMPTAPLIRLVIRIYDQPGHPYQFESFLNIAEEEQADILARLAGQEQLYLQCYGEGIKYRFTEVIPHDQQQWQLLDDLVAEAEKHLSRIPIENRDFDQAKSEFMKRFV